MLLTQRLRDDIILSMKLRSFRQWVACVTMVAVLFGTTAPFGFCMCEDCHCKRSISRLLPNVASSDAASSDTAVADGKCCCIPPEPLPKGCCGLLEEPCSCACGDTQHDVAVIPAILPVKPPKITPPWSTISFMPVGHTNVSGLLFRYGNLRAMLPSHVPLHVLLCVFLN